MVRVTVRLFLSYTAPSRYVRKFETICLILIVWILFLVWVLKHWNIYEAVEILEALQSLEHTLWTLDQADIWWTCTCSSCVSSLCIFVESDHRCLSHKIWRYIRVVKILCFFELVSSIGSIFEIREAGWTSLVFPSVCSYDVALALCASFCLLCFLV